MRQQLFLLLLAAFCLFLPALVHTTTTQANANVAPLTRAAASPVLGFGPGSPSLIVKTIDGNLHYVRLNDRVDRLSRLWSINLGELITSNLEDVKVEYGNVVNLYRIIPSLEGFLYKYSFSLIKNEPQAIDDGQGLVIDADDDDDDDDNDEMDADTGNYYPHSRSKDRSKRQSQRSFEHRTDGSSSRSQKPAVSVHNEVYEKIPFDMDDLLKSTFLFNNDLTFTGSIHSDLIRVSHKHGKLIPSGSIKEDDEQVGDSEEPTIINDDDDDDQRAPSADQVFVIKQTRYDLKAISIKNGTEKWNLNLIKNEIIKYPRELVVGQLDDDDQKDCFMPKKKHEHQLAAIEGLLEFDVASGRIRIEHATDQVIIELPRNDSVLDLQAPIVACELVYKGISKQLNIFAQKKSAHVDQSSKSAAINTSMKRASKSTTSGLQNGYDFMSPASQHHDNRSKRKESATAVLGQVYPWSSSAVAATDASRQRRNTFDLTVIYIGVYKNKFYAQNRYDPIYERFIHLRHIYDDGSPEFDRCARPNSLHGIPDDLKLISQSQDQEEDEDDYLVDASSGQLSTATLGDRKRDKLFAFLEKLKVKASSLLSYGKICRLLSTYFFEDHSNCNDLDYFEEAKARAHLFTSDSGSSAKYELSRTQEDRCDAKKSGSSTKGRTNSNSQVLENSSNSDLRKILIIVVSTSIISISFATFIFIKFNKRINGFLFFKEPAESLNASSDESLNKSPGPLTPKNKSAIQSEFFSESLDTFGDTCGQNERKNSSSSSSSSSGSSNDSRISIGPRASRRKLTSSQSENSISDRYKELASQPPPELPSPSKSANTSIGHEKDHSKSVGDVLKLAETPFLHHSVSKDSNELSLTNMAEMSDSALLSLYESRYLNEFEHIRLIGKGGFGRVFEAKHKIDERVFAIKRIKLKNSQHAKDRVLREVRSLAKLESPYIVRYFHSWFEYPPSVWQTLVDRRILLSKEYENSSLPGFESLSIAPEDTNDSLSNTQFSIESSITEENSHDVSSSFSSLSSSAQMNESTRKSVQVCEIKRPRAHGKQCDKPTPNDRILNTMDVKFYNDDSLRNSAKGKKKPTKRLKQKSKMLKSSSIQSSDGESISFSSVEFQLDSQTAAEEGDDDFDDLGVGSMAESSERSEKKTLDDSSDDDDDDDIVFERSNADFSDESSDDDEDSEETNDLTNDMDSSFSIVFKEDDDDQTDEGKTSKVGVVPPATPVSGKDEAAETKKSHTPSEHGKTTTTTKFIYFYIQMELCQRETLGHWLKSRPERDHKEILRIFDQILTAILYIHSHDLIHRDLKPSNIFLSLGDQTIRIGDFGLVVSAEEHVDEENSGAVTGSTSPLALSRSHGEEKQKPAEQYCDGTFLYMSPEQHAGQEYNSKVDIFSLGIILFELIVPFKTDAERNHTLNELRKRRFPESFERNYPIERNLISLLIEPDPEKRLSAEQIRQHPAYLEFKSAYST